MSDDDPLNGLRQAYADTFDYTNPRDRCLCFLMQNWVNVKYAKRAVHLIGDYGMFDTTQVIQALEEIKTESPTSGFTFGRETSPVLYVETPDPVEVSRILNEAHPQELTQLSDGEDLGNVRPLRDDQDIHASCVHDEPPVPDGTWAHRRLGDVEFIRAWWDDG